MRRMKLLSVPVVLVALLTLVGFAGGLSTASQSTTAGQTGGTPCPSPMAMASPGASPAASPSASPTAGCPPAAAGGVAQLEAVDIGWVYQGMDTRSGAAITMTLSPGQTIAITNTGALPHDFTVEEWGVMQDLPNGETVEVQVPQDLQSGQSFEFICTEPGHAAAGMVGTIVIQ